MQTGERERAKTAIGRHLGGRRCRLFTADGCGRGRNPRSARRALARARDPKIAEYDGRIVKTTGDGLLVEFGSVVDAVRCAVDVQRKMAERNSGVPADQCIAFRIGINVGDIIIDDGDIFGDGQRSGASGGFGGSGRHLRKPGRARSGSRQARSDFPGHGRATGQEHCKAGACSSHPDRCGTPCVAIADR